MVRKMELMIFGVGLLIYFSPHLHGQDVVASNAEKWSMSGRVQLQHSYSSDIATNADETNNGFRIRRGRLQVKGELTQYVSTKFQIEVRDNSPRLKDAEGKLKLFNDFHLRLGQFKVPVWREELRSSGKLLLVERSPAAEFLAEMLLSARHVGVEFGGQIQKGVSFAVNYSNGSGEGGREDAGRSKSLDVNNGKLFTGRVNVTAGETIELGLSAAANQLGNKIGNADTSGTVYALAPDFGIYLDSGVDFEGGIAFGGISKDLIDATDDQKFMVADITGRWHTKLDEPNPSLAGMDGIELAGGISYIEPNTSNDKDEIMYFRFGPALNFGKHTRIQVNGEVAKPTADGADTFFLVRSQATLNF
jgi:hypothetical protein